MESQTVNWEENYVNWLYGKVADEEHEGYFRLLYKLYSIPFYPVVRNDQARVRDGYLLREAYCDRIKAGYEESAAIRFHLNSDTSVLEVLAALADRCDGEIMWDPDKGNRTHFWFWKMIDNLGLGDCSDENWTPETEQKVLHAADIFIGREYFPDGNGGIFPLKHPSKDQRKVELWYQMQYWLQENFEF